MAWGRECYYKPGGEVAQAPWEKRDSWPELDKRQMGIGGPQADIHAVSHGWITLVITSRKRGQREARAHLTCRAMDD